MFHIYLAVLSVLCSIVITCLERTDLLDLLSVVFSCVFETVPYVVMGQVWYLIVSISDLCIPLYFNILLYSKTCVKRPLLKRQKLFFKTNYRLMQVKSIAE